MRATSACVAAIALMALCHGVAAANPVPPVLSSTFVSGIIIQAVPWGLLPPGQFVGYMGTDSVQFKTLQIANESSFDVEILQLYKSPSQAQGMEYQYVATAQTCTPETLSDEYFAWFGWLSNAHYAGPTILQEQAVDFWVLNSTNMMLGLYVQQNGAHMPVRLITASTTDQLSNIIDFYDFQQTAPPASDFVIPPYCQDNTAPANAQRAKPSPKPAAADSNSRLGQFRALTRSINSHIGRCTMELDGEA